MITNKYCRDCRYINTFGVCKCELMNKPTNYYDMACDKFSDALCYGIRKNTTKADNETKAQ